MADQRLPVLKTTSFDRASSLLTATIVCAAGLLFFLLMLWLMNLDRAFTPPRVGGGNNGIEIFPGTPRPAMSPLVASPNVVTDDPSVQAVPSLIDQLVEVLEQVSQIEAPLVDEPPGGVPGRGPGADGGGSEVEIVVPPTESDPERWVFVIDRIANIDEYSQLLDQFEIEVGTFDTSGRFAFLSRVAAPRPTLRRPITSRDERFYTLWQSGTLAAFDATLFRRAGIESRDQQYVHFFSAKLEAELRQLELKATRANGHRLSEIRRTWFTIEKNGTSFRFRVMKQQQRN